jgi:hypothetical protein
MSQRTITSQKMIRILLFTALILTTSPVALHAQISIDNTTYTANTLVDGVLLPSGSGTAVSNTQFRGCLNVSGRYQLGYFSTATTTQAAMGFTEGVVLSTGNTSDIPLSLGTNPGSVSQMSRNYTSGTSGEIRSSNGAASQDADIDNLIAPENYYNGAVLEFDFIPVSTDVSFRYIFGSEEYNDQSGSAFAINYNCSSYNDKFAFLISGPGISGGQGYQNDAINIARLTNNSEVGINSVNDGVVGSSGGAPNASNCSSANGAWTQNTPTSEFLGFVDGTELNGNTQILSATYSGLTPGATYHIRLMIADANDGAYDSVVFLEAASFTTDPNTLPVELKTFQVDCHNEEHRLNWTTLSERNNDHFLIESSLDGLHFDEVQEIPAIGNSQQEYDYETSIPHHNEGVVYYRISQIDADGTMKILRTQSATTSCSDDIDISLQENQLVIQATSTVERVEIVSHSGQMLLQWNAAKANIQAVIPFDANLKSGHYLIRITTKNGSTTKSLSIQ